jgi:hypothetical protein
MLRGEGGGRHWHGDIIPPCCRIRTSSISCLVCNHGPLLCPVLIEASIHGLTATTWRTCVEPRAFANPSLREVICEAPIHPVAMLNGHIATGSARCELALPAAPIESVTSIRAQRARAACNAPLPAAQGRRRWCLTSCTSD